MGGLPAQLVLSNRLVMIPDVGRELVGTVSFGNKIQKIGVRRIKDGFDGIPAGVCNRPRRKPSSGVGVIGRGGNKILPGEVPIEVFYPVDNRGVRLQAHTTP